MLTAPGGYDGSDQLRQARSHGDDRETDDAFGDSHRFRYGHRTGYKEFSTDPQPDDPGDHVCDAATPSATAVATVGMQPLDL